MQYPLLERIGEPDLLTGREREFELFHKWIKKIPKKLSKSRVILARRKSGKTSFIQRIFNELWTENGKVIPLFFEISENKIWYPNFAVEYYCTFASQYISFLERDETLAHLPLSLEEIKEYGEANSIDVLVKDVNSIISNKETRLYNLMWKTAYTAPERFGALFDHRFLVIIDEFQNITEYIYPDENRATQPDRTMAGSFHFVSESKIAPMLVTGSYVGWLINIMDQHLEAGRLKRFFMNPYLTEEEGLQAVFRYAHYFEEEITNESKEGVPVFIIATNKELSQVVKKRPTTVEALRQISGFGKKKVERHGRDLIEIVTAFFEKDCEKDEK